MTTTENGRGDAPTAPAITRDLFYRTVRAALRQYRRDNPSRYLNDDQVDSSDADFVDQLADQHAKVLVASALEQPAAAPIDDFNGDTNSLIRSIMTLLEVDAAAVLGPHGVGGHSRKLLAAAAARLAAAPPHDPGPKRLRQFVAQSGGSSAPADARAAFDYDDVVSICDAHGLSLPVDCIEMVVEIVKLSGLLGIRPASATETGAEDAIPDEMVLAAQLHLVQWGVDLADDRVRTIFTAMAEVRAETRLPAPVAVPHCDEMTACFMCSEEQARASIERCDTYVAGLASHPVEQAGAGQAQPRGMTFQSRVLSWLIACFGSQVAADRVERNHRFFEEAGELVQACGMTREEAQALVDYTWSRPIGEPAQEVGGVMVTLAALCLANGLNMHAAGDTELTRINVPETIAKIRAKQAAKPKHSPLPEAPRSRALAAQAPACASQYPNPPETGDRGDRS